MWCKVSGKSWFILCGKKLNVALTLYLLFLIRGIQKLLGLELFMSKFFMFSALIDVAVASLVHSSLLFFLYWTIVCLPALILLDFYFTVFCSGPDLAWTDNRPGAFLGSGPWEFLNFVFSALPLESQMPRKVQSLI